MNIIESLKATLEVVDLDLNDLAQIERFSKANKEYDELVKSGLTEKRGNRLMPMDKAHLINTSFNSKDCY